MTCRFVIGPDSYALVQGAGGAAGAGGTAVPGGAAGEWTELAVLPGGALSLLPPSLTLDEASIEAAIERAEDWLMPHAVHLQGQELEVLDGMGRLAPGLASVLQETGSQWVVDEFEDLFRRLVDMATGRRRVPELDGQQLFVAVMVMLRELAHHGRVSRISLV